RVNCGSVSLASAHWPDAPATSSSSRFATVTASASKAPSTAIAAAWDGSARAVLVVADTVKPTSAAAVAELKRLGLRPVLLTGDNAHTASTLAAEVGIDEVIPEVLPADKAAVHGLSFVGVGRPC